MTARLRKLRRKVRRALVLAAFAMPLTGCATMLTPPTEWFEKKPEFVTPHQLIPVWTDTVLHQAGQPGLRGCGGRIMFYSAEGKRSVRVDGSLIVYVWDDSRSSPDRKPDRKYVFRADELQRHYSKSKVGDSYSFWIPWDEAGGRRTVLTVVARFIGRDSSEVTSTAANVILPGAVELPDAVLNDDDESSRDIQRVSHQVSEPLPAAGTSQAAPHSVGRLQTSEIPLTSGFLQRNLNGAAVQAFSGDDLLNGSEPPSNFGHVPQPGAGGFASGSVDRSVPAGASSDGQFTELTSPPPQDRSLRFRHRVRNSRESQRSVDHALSERYRSEPRTAPWERD
ncbi:MAG: hypothetical protein R3C19_08385 [Planctomycetaceae bacterium]